MLSLQCEQWCTFESKPLGYFMMVCQSGFQFSPPFIKGNNDTRHNILETYIWQTHGGVPYLQMHEDSKTKLYFIHRWVKILTLLYLNDFLFLSNTLFFPFFHACFLFITLFFILLSFNNFFLSHTRPTCHMKLSPDRHSWLFTSGSGELECTVVCFIWSTTYNIHQLTKIKLK